MPIRLLKSALFGVLAAAGGLFVWVVGSLVAGMLWLQAQIPEGAGGLGAVSGEIPGTGGLVVSGACFTVGAVWMYRRLQRRLVR